MYEGKILWFHNRGGFGIIKRNDGEDIFISVKGVNLYPGNKIKFNVETTKNGLSAKDVILPNKI